MERVFGVGKYDMRMEAGKARRTQTFVREWETVGANVIAKAVCKTCNESWMQELDLRAHPLIEPAVRGEPTRVTTLLEISTVAAWAAKVAMCLSVGVSDDRSLPGEAIGRQFRETQIAPSHYRIRTVTFEDEGPLPLRWNAVAQSTEVLAKPPPRPSGEAGFSVTFRIGGVVFQVFCPPFGPLDKDAETTWDDRMTTIWPLTYSVLEWPTAASIDAIGLTGLARAYVSDAPRI